MNTAQLQCFLTVADTLNFARAAEQLHITQPAVTQQIQSLEKELGVHLFHRTTHSVRMSPEGQAFYPDAQQIVRIEKMAKKRFENPAGPPVQPLVVGCTDFASLRYLRDALKALRQSHPTLRPLFQVIPFQHIYQRLAEGNLDLVAAFPPADSKKVRAVYREICRCPIRCILPEDHPLASRACVPLAALQSEPLVLFSPNRAPQELFRLQTTLADGKQPDQLYFADSAEAIATLVFSGFGISLLPDLLVPPDLHSVPLEGAGSLSFGVYYKTLKDAPLLQEFIRLLESSAARQP